MSKLLKIFFIFLLLVIVGEIIFFLYNNNNSKVSSPKINKTTNEVALIKARMEHFTSRDVYRDDWIDLRPIEVHNAVVSDDTLNQLKELYQTSSPDLLKSSTLILEYEGTLEKINPKRDASGRLVELDINLRGFSKNLKKFTISGTLVSQLQSQIYEKTASGQFKKIDINQLQVGDRIILRSTRDMMADWNWSYLLDQIIKIVNN